MIESSAVFNKPGLGPDDFRTQGLLCPLDRSVPLEGQDLQALFNKCLMFHICLFIRRIQSVFFLL